MAYVVLSVALVSVVVALVFVVSSNLGRRRLPPAPTPIANPLPPKETPREILDRRFAAGEIDLEEYAEKRAAIEESRLPRMPRSGDSGADEDTER
ncbi:MAG: SHOCT domain-containing protein [Actinobacteria bacterium]|nr:SHOCT domain-containing protein [Actinomycetota bacterium]